MKIESYLWRIVTLLINFSKKADIEVAYFWKSLFVTREYIFHQINSYRSMINFNPSHALMVFSS
jgi:hypothetical protein